MKVRSIAKPMNDQPYCITIYHDKHAIRLNAFIIIIPIERLEVAEVGDLIVDIER